MRLDSRALDWNHPPSSSQRKIDYSNKPAELLAECDPLMARMKRGHEPPGACYYRTCLRSNISRRARTARSLLDKVA